MNEVVVGIMGREGVAGGLAWCMPGFRLELVGAGLTLGNGIKGGAGEGALTWAGPARGETGKLYC